MEFQLAKQNRYKPFCIICDLDGTLADNKWRNPFDTSKCDQDPYIPSTLSLLEALSDAGYLIIIVSGREGTEDCIRKTMSWLKDRVKWHDIHFRSEKDFRPDDIVKYEIYKNLIEPNYYVELVIDDRLKVCRMWHKIGLPLYRFGDPDAVF